MLLTLVMVISITTNSNNIIPIVHAEETTLNDTTSLLCVCRGYSDSYS